MIIVLRSEQQACAYCLHSDMRPLFRSGWLLAYFFLRNWEIHQLKSSLILSTSCYAWNRHLKQPYEDLSLHEKGEKLVSFKFIFPKICIICLSRLKIAFTYEIIKFSETHTVIIPSPPPPRKINNLSFFMHCYVCWGQ